MTARTAADELRSVVSFGMGREDCIAFVRAHHAALLAALEDQRRMEWLCAEHERHDPLAAVVWKANGRQDHEWVNTNNLIREIDAAIAQSAQGEGNG